MKLSMTKQTKGGVSLHYKKTNILYKKMCFFLLLSCILLSTSTAYAATSPLSSNNKRYDLSGQDPLALTRISESWSYYRSSREVIVAVIDTGVDIEHEDLKDHIWTNDKEISGNGIDDDGNGYIDDIHGWNFYNNSPDLCSYNEDGLADSKNNDNHGTHVAGIIGAVADNGVGIAGVASNINVKILPLKVTGGENGTGKTSSLIKAIQYASDMGASICNISLNSSKYNEELYLTMLKSPMLFVCSSGNNDDGGVNIDKKPTYPASFSLPNLISVAAIDSDKQFASYSNYGKNSVEIAAPGTRIYSTLVGNSYGRFTGTSMATPFVSGVAAILNSISPNFYASELKNLIINSASPLDALSKKVSTGGILDATSAVLLAKDTAHKKDKKAPTLTLSSKKGSSQVSISISDKSSGIKTLSYLSGKHSKSDFKNGKRGKTVTSLTLKLSKGTYTFYASDWEGNEVVKTIQITE